MSPTNPAAPASADLVAEAPSPAALRRVADACSERGGVGVDQRFSADQVRAIAAALEAATRAVAAANAQANDALVLAEAASARAHAASEALDKVRAALDAADVEHARVIHYAKGAATIEVAQVRAALAGDTNSEGAG